MIFKWLLFAHLVFHSFTSIVTLENIVSSGGYSFSNYNIISRDLITRTDDTICVELIVGAVLETARLLGIRDANLILVPLSHRIGSIKDRPEEASIDGRLIQHD